MKNFPNIRNLPISGLKVVELDQRLDERGWFEETWQSSKFAKLGVELHPVQSNVSFNAEAGVTRGMHAEPWDKLVTVTTGSAFGAWVDLRPGPDYLKTFTLELTPGVSVFVPAGVANGFQTTSESTTYSYLVTGHWSPGADYKMIHPFDPRLALAWPMSSPSAKLSLKDSAIPIHDAFPVFERDHIVLIGSGQIGLAIQELVPEVTLLSREEVERAMAENSLDILVPKRSIVINAAAFTSVDDCESPGGRDLALSSNFQLVNALAAVATANNATLVHFSSDYVLGGEGESPNNELAVPTPRNFYGVSKLLGDLSAQNTRKHYILRLSGVYGQGSNFIKTIAKKALAGQSSDVVDDIFSRPTSAKKVAEAVIGLLNYKAPYGLYNFSDDGPPVSWFDLARKIYDFFSADVTLVRGISSETYAKQFPKTAQRPKNSVLDLSKIKSLGFIKCDPWESSVSSYLENNF